MAAKKKRARAVEQEQAEQHVRIQRLETLVQKHGSDLQALGARVEQLDGAITRVDKSVVGQVQALHDGQCGLRSRVAVLEASVQKQGENLYWQSTRGGVLSERVEKLEAARAHAAPEQPKAEAPDDFSANMRWLENAPAVYAGKWVALKGGERRASSATLKGLRGCLDAMRLHDVLVAQVPPLPPQAKDHAEGFEAWWNNVSLGTNSPTGIARAAWVAARGGGQ